MAILLLAVGDSLESAMWRAVLTAANSTEKVDKYLLHLILTEFLMLNLSPGLRKITA